MSMVAAHTVTLPGGVLRIHGSPTVPDPATLDVIVVLPSCGGPFADLAIIPADT